MKKIIAMLLALVMVCGLATTAFAADINNNEGQPNYTVDTTATFVKSYEVKSGTAPAETFHFVVDEDYFTFVDQHEDPGTVAENLRPTVEITDPEFANNMAANATAYTANATVTIGNVNNNTPLGVYTYKINETAGTTAGVNYTANPVYLVVTVLRDEESNNHHVAAIHYTSNIDSNDKEDTTDNSYEAGELTVFKQITGNMANMGETFSFKAEFTAEEGTVFNNIQVVNKEGVTITDRVVNGNKVTITFDLVGDNASATFINIPDGTTYTVEETEDKGYDLIKTATTKEGYTDGNGTVNHNDKDVIEFTNELKSDVDTGVVLDSAPYFLMLAVAVIGMVALVSKKRYEV